MGESQVSQKTRAGRIAAGGGAILSLGASLVTTASPAGAATFNVTTNADAGAGSLRDAIAQANAAAGPDTITFQAGLGTITLTTGHIVIDDALTITDPEADVTVDGNGNDRIFYINNAGAVTITGLTLTNGDTGGDGGAVSSLATDLTITDSTISGNAADWGGGVFAEEGAVTVTDTTFQDNEAEDYGGGLAVYDSLSATVTGSTFTGNYAYSYGGGAIFDNVATISVTDSTFTGNEAAYGYGGGFWAYDADSLTVTGSTFTDNTAYGDGGGFGTEDVVSVTVTDSTFTGNYAGSDGGGFSIYGDGVTESVTITGVTVTDNTSDDQAGGVVIQSMGSGTVDIADSTFTGNEGILGGGVTIARTTDEDTVAVSIAGSTFTGNDTDNAGGGLYLANLDGTVTISTSTFDDNTASYGGGIAADNAGTVSIVESTISNNAANTGGGIASGETVLTVTNSTISGNLAEDGGGGLAVYGVVETNLTIEHSTITGNTASYGGGAMLGGYGTATLDHNIIDGNVANGRVVPGAASPSVDEDGSALFIAAGKPIYEASVSPQALESVTLTNNIVNGTIAGTVVDAGGNQFDVSALLGALADNGGPTLTHLPGAGSPALDTGDPAFAAPPATDQRGLPRVSNDRIDIGAVEVQVQEPVVPPVVPPVAPPAEPVPAQPTFTG